MITDDLEIDQLARHRFTVFSFSGRMAAREVAELKEGFDSEYQNIILDLRDLRLTDGDAVRFLKGCETDGMKLENCPTYIRKWMGSMPQ
jgi:hypothetical protein